MKGHELRTGLLLLAAPATALAEEAAAPGKGAFTLPEVFALLFLTLGPLKVVIPFARMTAGRDRAFARQLAAKATAISAGVLFLAATVGVWMMGNLRIPLGALVLTAGLLLFLVALRQVLEQPPQSARSASQVEVAPAPQVSDLSFTPLAVPTIVTPYGIALLILLITVGAGDLVSVVQIGCLVAIVLFLDVLAMWWADRLVRIPLVQTSFRVLGAIVGVLLMALGVRAAVAALHLLGLAGGATD